MILFYNKKTGKVFASIQGRVHDEQTCNCMIKDSNTEEKDIGKIIIGWEDTNEEIEVEKEIEDIIDLGKGLFQKVKKKQKFKEKKKILHNEEHFSLMQEFEESEDPLNYKITKNKNRVIIKK